MYKVWIKVYMEIIDDPKMATLPDRLWRRVIELFLLAGRVDQEGALPEINQIAWALRMDVNELALDMQQIEATGIIQRTARGWLVVNFSKRQSAMSDAERKRQERDRKNKEQYYDVTPVSRNVTQNRIDKNRIDKNIEDDGEPRDVGEIITLYENNIGLVNSPMLSEKLTAWEQYPIEWVREAIDVAVTNNARSYAYVNTILERWKRDGFKSDSRPKKVEYKDATQRRQDRQRQVLIDLYNMPDEEEVIDGNPI